MPRHAHHTPGPLPGTDARVRLLRRLDAYPDQPTSVETVETHMAWVFLTDRHVYKLKKPVRYEYLDFSTPEARRHDCAEEVRLNRRLAPSVYLGVVPLTLQTDGRMRLGGDGEPIDWLVRMRRLPRERMLEARIAAGDVSKDDARRIGSVLARFYQQAPRIPMTPAAYRRRLTEQAEADGRELTEPRYGLPDDLVWAVPNVLLRMLRENAALVEHRAAEGRIVEVHGDLRPEHVCLTEPEPVIIDCIEFNRDFRILDPVSELAYLALECDRLGAGWVGRAVLQTYRDLTGDRPADRLVRLYEAVHACLRAKIAVWHLNEPEPTVRNPTKWRQRAEQYLHRAAELLRVSHEDR